LPRCLITFVPCSARSAIILALAGKYLGGLGVFTIFMLTMVVIALLGGLLARRFPTAVPDRYRRFLPMRYPPATPLFYNTGCGPKTY